MASPSPICTESQEPDNSENSPAGTFITLRGQLPVWRCTGCARRERAVLLDALREVASVMLGRPDIERALAPQMKDVQDALRRAHYGLD